MIKACGQEIEIFLSLEMSKPKFFFFYKCPNFKILFKKITLSNSVPTH